MTEEVAQLPQLARGDVGLRQQPRAQQVGERARVDRVVLHPRGGDRLGAQRMRQVQLVAGGLEHVGEPLPAGGRLERDPGLAVDLLEQLEEGLRVVRDPAGEQLPSALIEHGDVRAAPVQVDADPSHTVLHGRYLLSDGRPRGRNPRGLSYSIRGGGPATFSLAALAP